MEIPDTQIAELVLGIFSTIGVIIGYFLKSLIGEIRLLHKSIDSIGARLSETREDMMTIAAEIAACKHCPHIDLGNKERKL